VRIAHLAPAAPPVDVYVNDKIAFDGVKFKDVTDYARLEGYEFSVVVVPAGGTLADAVNKTPVVLTFEEGDGGFYTVAAVGSPTDGTFALIMLPHDGLKEEAHGGAPEALEKGKAQGGALLITGAFARPTATEKSGEHSGHGGQGAEATAEVTPAMGGMSMSGVSAAYMLIENTSDKPDKLVSIVCDAASVVEIHETVLKNDMAAMQPMPGGLTVPALGMVELKPGGYHLMLLGLKRALVAGERITLTLTFESGVVVTLVTPVMMP
jgi:hypothetical protein